jgi:hypothetical protein
MAALPGGPGVRAATADLALFHREIDVVARRNVYSLTGN